MAPIIAYRSPGCLATDGMAAAMRTRWEPARRPRGNLSVVHSVGDRHSGLVSLTGAGIGQLTQPTARDLLVSLLTRPGAPLRQGVTAAHTRRFPSLLIYLMINIPTDRRFWLRHAGRWGIGLVDRQSTVIVSLRSPWTESADAPAQARWRLDACGADHAARKLNVLLDEWQQIARDGNRTLHLNASGRGQALTQSFSWESR